jgi:hypothetical protein
MSWDEWLIARLLARGIPGLSGGGLRAGVAGRVAVHQTHLDSRERRGDWDRPGRAARRQGRERLLCLELPMEHLLTRPGRARHGAQAVANLQR